MKIAQTLQWTLIGLGLAVLTATGVYIFRTGVPARDALIQYTAPGGHVLGFGTRSIFVASPTHLLKIDFVGVRGVTPRTENQGSESGKPLPLSQVTYPNLWPGVTVVYEQDRIGILKSTFHVAPHMPVSRIRWRYNRPVRIDAQGNLIVSFPTGEMTEAQPVAWQETAGLRRPVQTAYRLLGKNEVGFTAAHDPRYALTIDPSLTWNTFLGGSGTDYSYGIAIDGSGNVYLSGNSSATWGSPVRAYTGSTDAFAAKLASDGSLTWSTFLGGALADFGDSIAVDAGGNVYITGRSAGTWGSPVRSYTSLDDAFVAKLASNGSLIWNTFLGGTGSDYGTHLTPDGTGGAFSTGYSNAAWGSPIRAFTSVYDAFVAKLASDGSLTWNTFLGGSGNDFSYGLTSDGSGNVFAAGRSSSTWGSPVRAFSFGDDAFAAKLASDGSLTWNTFLGGSGTDISLDIDVDENGSVYIAGTSNFNWGSPVRAFSSGDEAFAAKLASDGSLTWNTFLGGSGTDNARGLVVDTGGNVFTTGVSNATWGSPARNYSSAEDAFAAKTDTDGNLIWNLFLGGSGTDNGQGIAIFGSMTIYVTGHSNATWGSPVRAYTSGIDGFAARIQDTPSATPTQSPTSTLSTTQTPTPSPVFTLTHSPTPTHSPTVSATRTASPSPSHTPSFTLSATQTPSRTSTLTLTPSPAVSHTASPSGTPTQTPTPFLSPTPSVTRIFTPDPASFTPTFTVIPTGGFIRLHDPVIHVTRGEQLVLELALVQNDRVSVRLYNLDGRSVITVLDAQQPSGTQLIIRDLTQLGAGTYLLHAEAGAQKARFKIVVLR